MDRAKFDECVSLLNAWFECPDHAEQGTFNRARWAVKQLGTELGLGITEQATECDDCGIKTNDLITKGDHHGGMKTVCRDRDACHRRSPG